MKPRAVLLICTIICVLLSGCTEKQQRANRVDAQPLPRRQTNIPLIDVYSGVEFISTSPDSSTLAMVSVDDTNDTIYRKYLILFSFDTQKVLCKTQISGWECRWSSDSKHIANLIETRPDNLSVVVMDLSGKTQSYPAGNYVPDMQFRKDNPNKLLYCKQVPGRYEIWEIDVSKREQKKLRDISKYNAGLSAFRGQDCYSEYDFKPCELGKLRVRKIDTNEVMLNCDLGGIDRDNVMVDFSPDSQWMAIRTTASASTFVTVGNVKDAMRFMTDLYVAAYTAVDNHSGKNIDWLPARLKSKDCNYVLLNSYNDFTVVDLEGGYSYINDRPGLASWWKGYKDQIVGVVIEDNLLKGKILDQGNMVLPETSGQSPDARDLAMLRKQDNEAEIQH